MHTLVTLAVTLLTAACRGGNPAPANPLDPIPLPQIPAEFVSDTLVVPAELEDEFAALMALPVLEWKHVDPVSLEGEQRRAAVYWRFRHRHTAGNSFWLLVTATDRDGAQRFVENLAAGWGMRIAESYYVAADQIAFYDLSRIQQPYFALGETAWLAEWLWLNYPQYVLDFIPHFRNTHSEGVGGGI